MSTRVSRAGKASTLVAMLWGVAYLPTGVLCAALGDTVLDPRIRLTGSVGLGR